MYCVVPVKGGEDREGSPGPGGTEDDQSLWPGGQPGQGGAQVWLGLGGVHHHLQDRKLLGVAIQAWR